MKQRPRRLRQSSTLRELVQETHVLPQHLIYPIFVQEGEHSETPIKALPGQSRWGLEKLLKQIDGWMELGIQSYALFPVIPEGKKNSHGGESKNAQGLLPKTLRAIKQRFPETCLFSDVALDPYSSDGHDGLVRDGEILNDETLPLLADMALVQAEAGADFVAPSDMMDGRVGHLRSALDQAGYTDCGILAYAAKYASSFYGPFREALDSAPKAGDKKTYQMNPANRREAWHEARLDIAEGADIIMVKPALPYLDVIRDLARRSPVPVAAYNVSGEYAMIKAAAERGWMDGPAAISEILTGIRRAGADMVLTYHAVEYASGLIK